LLKISLGNFAPLNRLRHLEPLQMQGLTSTVIYRASSVCSFHKSSLTLSSLSYRYVCLCVRTHL